MVKYPCVCHWTPFLTDTISQSAYTLHSTFIKMVLTSRPQHKHRHSLLLALQTAPKHKHWQQQQRHFIITHSLCFHEFSMLHILHKGTVRLMIKSLTIQAYKLHNNMPVQCHRKGQIYSQHCPRRGDAQRFNKNHFQHISHIFSVIIAVRINFLLLQIKVLWDKTTRLHLEMLRGIMF